MFRIPFMVFSISYAANTFFNPLECCCGCRTNSCPPQGLGCPSPRNPCVNAFFILRRQIAPCEIFERQRLGDDSFPSTHQKQADNRCRSPPCFIAPQHIPKNVLPYGNPKAAASLGRLAFRSVDASAGGSASERVILSSHPPNVPNYGQNDEYGDDRTPIAPSREAAPTATGNQRSQDEHASRRMNELHESPSQFGVIFAVVPSNQDSPGEKNTAPVSNKSTVSPHVTSDSPLSTSIVDNIDEGGTQGIVLVPASSIFIEASEPETFNKFSINEQTDPNVSSDVNANYDEHPEMLTLGAPEHFNGDVDTSGTGKQSTIDSAFLYSLLEQDSSPRNNEQLSVYDAISAHFHESQKGKTVKTVNKPLTATLSVIDRLHSTNQTENKSSFMEGGRDDAIPQKNSSDQSVKVLYEGRNTANDRQIGIDEAVNKTSRNERPFAQGAITVMKENNIDQLSSDIKKANNKRIQQAIVKIEQIDPTLAHIDSVLNEIQEVLVLVKEELEMDETDAYKQLEESRCAGNDKIYPCSLCKHDSNDVTEEPDNIVAQQANSNQQPKKHGIAYKPIKNVKGRNESDSEEVTDIIQEIIKNLRLMQLRSIKRKKYFKQTETGHKKLGPNLRPNVRSKRASAKEFLENPAPAQGSDSLAGEHDLYDDDIIISETKYTVAESQTTTLTPNSAVSNEPDIARSSDKENEMHVTATKEERVKHSDPVEKAEHLDEEKPGWTNNCNDEALKRIIERNIVMNDASLSKRKIQKAAENHFKGTFDVICSRAEFSYIIRSDTYCEGGKGEIACLAFRQEYP